MRRAIVFVCAVLLALLFFLQRRASVQTVAAGADEPLSGAAEPSLSTPVELGARATTNAPASEGLVVPGTVAASREALKAEPAPADAPAPLELTVHGQVVDARSGIPVPGEGVLGVVRSPEHEPDSFAARLFAHSGTRLGAQGTFELTTHAPEELAASVVIWSSAQELEERVRHRYADERQPDGTWRLPIDIGFFARLELDAPVGHSLRLDRVSMIESVGGVDSPWPQGIVADRGPPFVLWRQAAFESGPGHARRLEVHAIEAFEEWNGQVEIVARNGVASEPIRVPMHPWLKGALRVVDESGEPWTSATVALLPESDAHAFFTSSRANSRGEVELERLAPGPNRVRVSVPFTPAQVRTIECVEGEPDLGTLVVARDGHRGEVSGELVASTKNDERRVELVLRDPRTGAERFESAWFEEPGRERARFEFRDVPPGRYELDVLSPRGWSCRALPQEVDAPRADIVIEMERRSGKALALRCLDADTLAPIDDRPAEVVRRGVRWTPFDSQGTAASADESLIVLAEGYRPRLVSPEPASRASVREVLLEHGWGRIVLVHELGELDDGSVPFCGRPLADVRVLADGSEVARSDAEGLALVALAQGPVTLSCERPGFRLVSSEEWDGIQLVRMVRER